MASLVNISEAASLGLHTTALLAGHAGERFTNRAMADALHASGHHLAKVMQRLVKAGIVDSSRGPQGGFMLAKPANQITLLEVYEAIDGAIRQGGCLFETQVCDGIGCVLGRAIRSIHGQLYDYLAKTKLPDLAASLSSLTVAGEESSNEARPQTGQ